MTNESEKNHSEFIEEVSKKSERMEKGRRRKKTGVWHGVGLFGLVGWSVAVPALLFLAVGIWIDDTWQSGYSWTLMLLVLGIGLGCFNAWYWIKEESKEER